MLKYVLEGTRFGRVYQCSLKLLRMIAGVIWRKPVLAKASSVLDIAGIGEFGELEYVAKIEKGVNDEKVM